MENILSGNPLINLAGQQQQQQMTQTQTTFRVKRRYLTNTHMYAQQSAVHKEKSSLYVPLTINNSFVIIFLGGTMMLCSRIAPKELTKHGRRNVL